MKAVILAAGKAKRLGAIVRSIPKPMLVIDGKPILEHSVELCRKNGIQSLFINLHYLPEVIKNYFENGEKWSVSITYKFEDTLLGTAGAIKNFEKELGSEPFFVLYGDNLINYDLGDLMKKHLSNQAEMSIAVFKLNDVRLSGMVSMDSTGKITEFCEKPLGKTSIKGWVNAGVYVMNPELLNLIPPGVSDFGKNMIPQFIEKGRRIMAVEMDHEVKAVDTPEMYNHWAKKG